MTVGIIGYGRFGRLAAGYIAKRTDVLVFDKKKQPNTYPSKRVRGASLSEVASQSIVILAVPVSSLQNTLHSITPFLRPKALVIDVCAVKAKPIAWMKAILPKHISILGTHPLFGPDSAGSSLEGHRVVLCPERISGALLRRVVREIKGTGLAIQKMTPNEHDEMIAESLFLSQFVGRLVSKTDVAHHAFSTNSYRELMKIALIAEKDTRELFRDMWIHNPHARRVVKKIVKAMQRVVSDLHLG